MNSIMFLFGVSILLFTMVVFLADKIIEKSAIGEPIFRSLTDFEKSFYANEKLEYLAEMKNKSKFLQKQTALERLRKSKQERQNQLLELDNLITESEQWNNEESKKWKQQLESLRSQKIQFFSDRQELENLRDAERFRQSNCEELRILREKNISSFATDIERFKELQILRSKDKNRTETQNEISRLVKYDLELSRELNKIKHSILETNEKITKAENMLSVLIQKEKTSLNNTILFESKYYAKLLNLTTLLLYNTTQHIIENNLTVQHCLINLANFTEHQFSHAVFYENGKIFKFACIDDNYVVKITSDYWKSHYLKNNFNLSLIVDNLKKHVFSNKIRNGLFANYKLKSGKHNNRNILLYLSKN